MNPRPANPKSPEPPKLPKKPSPYGLYYMPRDPKCVRKLAEDKKFKPTNTKGNK